MPARLDEAAAKGEAAVAELRAGERFWEKKLLHKGPELLDMDETPAGVKQRILDDVARISRILQLHRFWTWQIGKMIVEARRTRHGKPVRVLDVGAGSGALLFRLGDWARRRRIPVELHGIDSNAAAIEAARRVAGEEGRRVDLRAGDARALSHDAGSMDVVVTTFMLHHLPPGDAARVFAELDRVAAVNFFAFDLRRNLPAVPLLWGLIHAARLDAPSRHDSMASLRRGYTVPEIEAILRSAGVANFAVSPYAPAFFVASRA